MQNFNQVMKAFEIRSQSPTLCHRKNSLCLCKRLCNRFNCLELENVFQ